MAYIPFLHNAYFTAKVGIGTDSPDQQLEILYPSYINKDTVEGLLRLTGQSNTENAGDVPSAGVGIEFYNKWTGGLPYSIGRISARASQSYDGGLQFDVAQNSAPGQSNFTTAMTILDSGNVGIGTTSPGAKLEVVDGGLAAYIYSSQSTGLRVRGGGNSNDIAQFQNVGGSTVAVIDSAGNVGIGVTTTSYKLEVGGASKISGNVIIGTDPNTYANLTLKDATTTGSSSKSLYIVSQNSGRSFLSLITAGTGEAQIGFGTSQYVSQNTAGIIQYTTATHKFTFKTNYTLALTIANNQAATFTSTVTATNFILSSDKTLKNNIKEIDTNHVDVNWKNFELKSEPGVKRSGVIAQELEEKHPEFVRTDDEGIKSVAYIDLLIAKIAELEARLEKAGI